MTIPVKRETGMRLEIPVAAESIESVLIHCLSGCTAHEAARKLGVSHVTLVRRMNTAYRMLGLQPPPGAYQGPYLVPLGMLVGYLALVRRVYSWLNDDEQNWDAESLEKAASVLRGMSKSIRATFPKLSCDRIYRKRGRRKAVPVTKAPSLMSLHVKAVR